MAADSVPPAGGRRRYDPPAIDPEVEVFVERRLQVTRHHMRGELTEVISRIEKAQIDAARQASDEHAEVRDSIAEMRAEFAVLRGDVNRVLELDDRVDQLEAHDDRDEGLHEGRAEILATVQSARRWLIATAIAFTSLVVSAAGLVLVLA